MIPVARALERYRRAGLRPVILWGLNDDLLCACGKCDPDSTGRGKHPVSKGWQTERPSLACQLRELSRGPRNLGLAMGAQPSGDVLVALDFDGPFEALQADLAELAGPLPPTRMSLTSRGPHALYSIPGGVLLGNRAHLLGRKKGDPRGDVDVRGEGGQIVAPPSVHYSGHVYRWKDSTPIAALPERVADFLATRPEPIEYRRQSTHEERRDKSKAFQAACRYADKCDPAVQGQNGSTTTLTVAIKLAANFPELDESDLWSILADYNARCVPRWSERELAHKLSDALRLSRGRHAA